MVVSSVSMLFIEDIYCILYFNYTILVGSIELWVLKNDGVGPAVSVQFSCV